MGLKRSLDSVWLIMVALLSQVSSGCGDNPSSEDPAAGATGGAPVGGAVNGELGTGGVGTGGVGTGGVGTGGVGTGGMGTGGVSTSTDTGGTDTGGVGPGGATTGGAGGEAVPACAVNELPTCTVDATQIACHFGGDPGDYRVTVELGGEGAGDMFVEAEMHRGMLDRVTTAEGEVRRYSFVTNVREYEGQPLDPDQKGSSTGIPGLDVYILGDAPQLTAICHESVTPKPKVWIAGDSTVCDQGGEDYSGWGQHLPRYFDDPVSVANYADSGESSGSFLGGAKLWRTIVAGWSAGDWVIIQLGHNDKDVAAATFEANLTSMVTQAKSAGVHPILCTPISRVGYELDAEHVNSTGADLPQIIRDLGAREGVPVIDLTVTTWNWLQTIDWTQYFALGTDRTHPNPRGAQVIAGFVADGIRDLDPTLAMLLR